MGTVVVVTPPPAARDSYMSVQDKKRNAAFLRTCSEYWINERLAKRRVYPATPCYCRNCVKRERGNIVQQRRWPAGYVGSSSHVSLVRNPGDGPVVERVPTPISYECNLENNEPDGDIDRGLFWSTSSPTAASLELLRRIVRDGKKVKLKKGVRIDPEDEASLKRMLRRKGYVWDKKEKVWRTRKNAKRREETTENAET